LCDESDTRGGLDLKRGRRLGPAHDRSKKTTALTVNIAKSFQPRRSCGFQALLRENAADSALRLFSFQSRRRIAIISPSLRFRDGGKSSAALISKADR
jgi:hypothetical protein